MRGLRQRPDQLGRLTPYARQKKLLKRLRRQSQRMLAQLDALLVETPEAPA